MFFDPVPTHTHQHQQVHGQSLQKSGRPTALPKLLGRTSGTANKPTTCNENRVCDIHLWGHSRELAANPHVLATVLDQALHFGSAPKHHHDYPFPVIQGVPGALCKGLLAPQGFLTTSLFGRFCVRQIAARVWSRPVQKRLKAWNMRHEFRHTVDFSPSNNKTRTLCESFFEVRLTRVQVNDCIVRVGSMFEVIPSITIPNAISSFSSPRPSHPRPLDPSSSKPSSGAVHRAHRRHSAYACSVFSAVS